MNLQVIRLLFLKDLFLSRKFLFGYLVGGLVAAGITCIPNQAASYVGFILMITVAIAAGIHFIGNLMLGESTDQTRMFVMSLPISLLDYSLGKISVVITTYLMPWTVMFAGSTICAFIFPWANRGSVVVLTAIFLFLLSSFMVQLVTAIVSESVGWTIGIMVACNVMLNLFLMKLFEVPEVAEIVESDVVIWPTAVIQILIIEAIVIAASLAIAIAFQTRKRDLI